MIDIFAKANATQAVDALNVIYSEEVAMLPMVPSGSISCADATIWIKGCVSQIGA